MAVDPAAQAVLDMMSQSGAPPLNELPVPIAREAYAGLSALAGEPRPVARTMNASADGVPVTLYWPYGEGPHPVLIWVHGGGWVLGSAAASDATARDLALRTEAIVVSVDYRLAPEHPFPAAIEDVAAAARWTIATIGSLGGDPTRMAIGGDSAGATLSTVTAMSLPGAFALQVLVYPATDLTLSQPSIEENGEGYLLTKTAMTWFGDMYLSGHHDLKDPRISPLFATDEALAASPSALVFTAEYDPLRDEGEAYAARLVEVGVPVEHMRYPGQIHAFYSMPAAIPAAVDALDRTSSALLRAWGLSTAG